MLHIIALVLMPLPGLFVSVNMVRVCFVRGSRPRFRLATLCRAIMWPALAEPVLSAADDLTRSLPVGLPFAAAMLAIVAYVARLFLDDDDDDWFTRAGRRIKRWATTTIRRWQARPVPAASADRV